MSKEIASADALLTANAELRAALDVALQENDGWHAAAAQLTQAHHDAWVLIGRIDMALELLPKRPSLRTIQRLVKQLRGEIKKAPNDANHPHPL